MKKIAAAALVLVSWPVAADEFETVLSLASNTYGVLYAGAFSCNLAMSESQDFHRAMMRVLETDPTVHLGHVRADMDRNADSEKERVGRDCTPELRSLVETTRRTAPMRLERLAETVGKR